jgi:Ca2+-binding RTX toxin-like protein
MQRFLGGEVVVVGNTDIPRNSTPSIFELPEGGWVSTWFEYDPTPVTRQQRFDQDGNKVGDVTTIANYGYVTVGLANGGWVIGSSVGNWGFDANVSLYDANGTLLISQLRVNSGSMVQDALPSIAGLADGGWIMTWAGYLTDGSPDYEPDVYQQRYSASGVALGPNQRVNTSDALEHELASVTALSDGGWLVAWGGGENHATAGGYQNVLLQRYDKDGNVVGGEVRVSDPDKKTNDRPSITELEDGGWVVAWWNGSRIYQKRYDKDGNALGEPASPDYIVASPPQVDALADGGWVMSYFAYHDTDLELRVQAFATDGKAAGGAVVIDAVSIYERHTIEALDDGRFVVTFVSDSEAEVRQQVFSMGENAVPVSTDDQSTMLEGTAIFVDVLANDTDDDGDRLTIESAAVVHGSAKVTIDFGQLVVYDNSGHLTQGETGTLVIEYTVTDGFETETGQVTIEVSGKPSDGDQIRGGHRSDHFQGTKFDEIYFGFGGNDIITGKSGDDLLFGGHGRDRIDGDSGEDTIVGGRGNDELSGGGGRDMYVFYKGDGQDHVRFGGYDRDIINVADFGFGTFKEVKHCIKYRDADMIIDLPGNDKITVIDGAYTGAYFAY